MLMLMYKPKTPTLISLVLTSFLIPNLYMLHKEMWVIIMQYVHIF